jgi:POT family proton-dependent oligopeptide transporter
MHHFVRNQPRGLFLLFFTELWERFGFYTLQTILVLYMTHSLLYDDKHAYLLYGAFSAMLYLTPVIGGYLADRFIGFRMSIIIGSLLYIVGYLWASLPTPSALFIGLSAVIVANGFFKPNVSSLVGELYDSEDPRRDGGFTLFYMGINIGSLIPPLFTGALVAAYGWHWGFVVAAVGIAIGLTTFLVGKKRLGRAGCVPAISPLHKTVSFKRGFYCLLALGIVVSIYLIHLVFYIPEEANGILIVASLFILIAVLNFLMKVRHEQRRKMLASLILMLVSVGFWAIYNQTWTSLMLFADRNMGKTILGMPIDAEFTQFFNPFFIVILSPFLSRFWVYLDQKKSNPSTPMKFSIGILFLALGFLFLGGAISFFSKGGISSPWWLAISYLLQTVGELLISPIGLSMVTRLSPRHLVGMMMGVWFLTQTAAFSIGGFLSTLSDVPKDASPLVSSVIYAKAFEVYGLIAMILAVVAFLLVPKLKKMIHSK